MFLLNGKKGGIGQWNLGPLLAKVAENWPPKVISVAMAIVLLVFHRMSLLQERFFSVPLGVETDSSLIPASPYPGTVRITLRGDANTIYPIMEDDIQAYVDLNKYAEPGTYRAPVQIRKHGTAVRTEALEISVDPLELVVTLDDRLSKTVAVQASFRGVVEPGYELSSYTLEPSHVAVEGPKGIVADVEELSTDYIELTGRSEDFSSTVRILNNEPLLIVRGNGFIEFHGAVREKQRAESFQNLPIMIEGLNDQFVGELEIGAGSVRIEGGQTIFDRTKNQDIRLYVDCSSINSAGDFLLPVLVFFPHLFTIIRQDPQQVIIHILRKQQHDEEDDES
jgi:YbbR domain-containing protein